MYNDKYDNDIGCGYILQLGCYNQSTKILCIKINKKKNV